jgi:hypothetical protein
MKTSATYYMPIKAINLSIYFTSAVVAPAKYFRNHIIDFQSKFEDVIILSKRMSSNDADCSLQLVFAENELESIKQISSNQKYYYFDGFVPVTRIKKIIFYKKEIKNITLASICINTAYIPLNIVSIAKKEPECIGCTAENNSINSTNDWQKNICTFDKMLGSLAMMKISNPQIGAYSVKYLTLLSKLNTEINADCERIKLDKKDPVPEEHKRLIKKAGDKNIAWNQDFLHKVATLEKQSININPITQLIKIDDLVDVSYIVASVIMYKVTDTDNGNKNISELILSNFNNMKDGTIDEFAYYYGYQKGYSLFPMAYGSIPFKFKLDSLLDYYIIESAYSYTEYKKRTPGKFEYLDEWRRKKATNINGKAQYIIDVDVAVNHCTTVGTSSYNEMLWEKYGCSHNINKSIFNDIIENIIKDVMNDSQKELTKRISEMEQNVGTIIFDIIDTNKDHILQKNEVIDFLSKLKQFGGLDNEIITFFGEKNPAIVVPTHKKSGKRKRNISEPELSFPDEKK